MLVRRKTNYSEFKQSCNVWFPAGKDITIAIKGINAQGNTTATLECQVGANVYDTGTSQDLNTLKVKCNGTNITLPSKIVTQSENQANIPFKLTVENVNISEVPHSNFQEQPVIIHVGCDYSASNSMFQEVEVAAPVVTEVQPLNPLQAINAHIKP